MPRGDGTGPMGQGPMTGRGMGFCAGYVNEGSANYPRGAFFGAGRGGRPRGGGMGRAWGGGRGRGFGYSVGPRWGQAPYGYAEANPADEINYVQNEIRGLESEIEELKKYLAKLEEGKKE